MRDGYVKYWRKTLDSIVYQHDTLFRLWMTCLALASYKDHTEIVEGIKEEIIVKQGQFITGRYTLHRTFYPTRRKSNLSPLSLWRLLCKLQDIGNLNIKTNNKYSIVTICNWGQYQSPDYLNEQQNEQKMNSRRTADEQQMNSRMNTNKNIKKDKNINNIYNNACAHEGNDTGDYKTTFEERVLAVANYQPFDPVFQEAERLRSLFTEITGLYTAKSDSRRIFDVLRSGITSEQIEQIFKVCNTDDWYKSNPTKRSIHRFLRDEYLTEILNRQENCVIESEEKYPPDEVFTREE